MLIDLNDASAPELLETDVCVVGGGAAGVALARNLAGRGHDVCLLEAGGMDFEQPTQDLCRGDIVGMEYYELNHSRLRFFGGTTNIWGGRAVPLDRIDFEKRDWVPHSGWPITLDDLQSYYRIAHDSLELGEYDYSNDMWEKLQLKPIAFDPEEITHLFWRFDSKKERFNSSQVDDLLAASKATIVLHANVVHIQAGETAREVQHLVSAHAGRARAPGSGPGTSYWLAAPLKTPACCCFRMTWKKPESETAATRSAAISWSIHTAGSPISKQQTPPGFGRIIANDTRKPDRRWLLPW